MRRIKKLLPNKYYLDKHFYSLRDKLTEEFKRDQKEFGNDVLKMFSQSSPEKIIEEIITMVLGSIRPKYKEVKKI